MIRHAESVHNKNQKIVFFHLKKTGGTSAYRHLYESVKRGSASPWGTSFGEAKKYDILGGHYEFEEVVGLGGTVISFFRNPIDRIISYYAYVQTLTEFELLRNDDASASAIRALDYESFVNSADPLVLRDSSNHYCKMLFGDDYKSSDLFEDEKPTEKLLNALGKINFIGIMEEFESSVNEMLDFLGLSQVKRFHWEKNIKTLGGEYSTIGSADQQGDLLSKLRSLNQDDIRLYKAIVSRRSRSHTMHPNSEIGLFPSLSPGSLINFHGNIKYLQNILFKGWHTPEDGVWSDGSKATLAFRPTVAITTVSLEIEIPEHRNDVSPSISIALNKGNPIVFHAIGTGMSVRLKNVLPDHYFAAIPSDRKIKLNVAVQGSPEDICVMEISINQLFVPSDHFETGDDRNLGFKLHSMTVI